MFFTLLRLLRFATLSLGLVFAAPAFSQSESLSAYTDVEIDKTLSQAMLVWTDDAFIHRFVAENTVLKGEYALMMERHVRAVLGGEKTRKRLVAVLRPGISVGLQKQELATYGMEAMFALQMAGFDRLSNADLEDFLRAVIAQMQWVPTEVCAKNARGELSTRQSQLVEHMWGSTRPLPEFGRYLSIYRRAFLA